MTEAGLVNAVVTLDSTAFYIEQIKKRTQKLMTQYRNLHELIDLSIKHKQNTSNQIIAIRSYDDSVRRAISPKAAQLWKKRLTLLLKEDGRRRHSENSLGSNS